MRRPVLGAVLAGGASSRFGSDKAMAMIGGLTLLDHARAAIEPFVEAVVVVGRGEVDDLPAVGLGPLGGIAGALDHARREGYASVLTIGCDMPAVPAGLVEGLLERAPAYCADSPVLGHWPVVAADELMARLSRDNDQMDLRRLTQPGEGRGGSGGETALKTSALSVRRWALDIGAVAIPAPAPLHNVNTPADLPPS